VLTRVPILGLMEVKVCPAPPYEKAPADMTRLVVNHSSHSQEKPFPRTCITVQANQYPMGHIGKQRSICRYQLEGGIIHHPHGFRTRLQLLHRPSKFFRKSAVSLHAYPHVCHRAALLQAGVLLLCPRAFHAVGVLVVLPVVAAASSNLIPTAAEEGGVESWLHTLETCSSC
jgi:hypothetical protein